MLLQTFKKVSNFKSTIFWHICAMNCILYSILSKLCSTMFSFIFSYLIEFECKYFAISGSWGPQKSRRAATTFYCLTSRAIIGPLDICSINGKYSGKTPLYTSKNSSTTFRDKLNISIADISNPASRIISITWPARPSFTIWGLINKSEQLFPTADVCMALFSGSPPNQKLLSLSWEAGASAPWTAFKVPSTPNLPLIEEGASFFATDELVGPIV